MGLVDHAITARMLPHHVLSDSQWFPRVSFLAWRIPWTEEPGRPQPMDLLVGAVFVIPNIIIFGLKGRIKNRVYEVEF